ncbi:MAG: hypothetical protein Q9170_007736 [Blastenia crenularia]
MADKLARFKQWFLDGGGLFEEHVELFLNILRFFLVEQFHLDTQSFWSPYLDTLPDPSAKHPFDTPLYYNDDDLKWIHGTSLEHSNRRIEESWHDEHAQGLRALRQDIKERYPWSVNLQNAIQDPH